MVKYPIAFLTILFILSNNDVVCSQESEINCDSIFDAYSAYYSDKVSSIIIYSDPPALKGNYDILRKDVLALLHKYECEAIAIRVAVDKKGNVICIRLYPSVNCKETKQIENLNNDLDTLFEGLKFSPAKQGEDFVIGVCSFLFKHNK